MRHRATVPSGAAIAVVAGYLMACTLHTQTIGVNPNDPRVAVPDASGRVEANTADSNWATRLRAQAVCLLRTGNAAGCRHDDEASPSCTERSEVEVNATLEALFGALPRITLTSPFTAVDSVHTVLPGAFVTRAVDDARRRASCGDWQGGPPCIAVRTADVWAVLYRTEPAPGPVQHVEILLAVAPCRANINP
jgi:hypothetical protein